MIGDKKTFGLEISDHSKGHMRMVDIWINGISICSDDNTVYVSQFISDIGYFLFKELDLKKYEKYFNDLTPEQIHSFIESTRDEDSANFDIEDDCICAHHQFMDMGPTTDNVSSFILEINGQVYITFKFWRDEHYNPDEINHVYKTTVNRIELRQVLSEAVCYLTSNKNEKV